MKNKKIFLVLGYVGSGKTTFLNLFKNSHKCCFNTDQYIHKFLYQRNQPGYLFVKKYFGESFVTNQEVNKSCLKKFFLNNNHNELQRLTHFVNHHINEYIGNCDNSLLIELPTYLDYCQDFSFQVTGYIFCQKKSLNEALFTLPKLNQFYNMNNTIFKSHHQYFYFDHNMKYIEMESDDLVEMLGKELNDEI